MASIPDPCKWPKFDAPQRCSGTQKTILARHLCEGDGPSREAGAGNAYDFVTVPLLQPRVQELPHLPHHLRFHAVEEMVGAGDLHLARAAQLA
jgi:hypothetical protein